MTSVATSLPSWTDLEKLDAVGHLLLEHRRDEHSLQAASSVLFDSFLQREINRVEQEYYILEIDVFCTVLRVVLQKRCLKNKMKQKSKYAFPCFYLKYMGQP